MRLRVGLGAAAALLWSSAAPATMVITADIGGSINQYEQRYAMVRDTGQHVVIDGLCFLACTLVLGMVPRERICVTPNARLGFHAAWFPDMDGGRVISASQLRSIVPACRQDAASRAHQAAAGPSGHTLEISAAARGLGRRL